MSVRVEVFAADAGQWEAVVRGRPGGTHCHRLEWRPVVEDVLGHEFLPLCARGPNGTLLGVLPLVRMRSMLLGRYLVSMPFLNYGGPVGTPEAVRALTDHACAMARAEGTKRLELRGRVELPIDLPASRHKVTSLLDLPAGGPEALVAGFASKLRSQIRRAEREAVEVRFGADQVTAFHRVFSEHMTRLGTPTYPRRFFEAVAAAFGDDAWFGCVYREGEPVAGGLAMRWGDEVEMTWAAALARYGRFAPNMLLYASFLRRAAAEGLARFDFGRSTPDSGTHRFKRQWGTRDEPLWWYGYAPGRTTGSTSSDMRMVGWAPALWQKLPVPVARVVGPPIRRAIPL